MIIRILTEGQYRLDSALLDPLNALDAHLMDAVAASDQEAFGQLLGELLAFVRKNGRPLAADELVESDAVLPPPDTTLEEAKGLMSGEGFVPG